MCGVGKTLPHNNKVILKDIYLSFFYGAKIGIIGLNGSGKSTLMKCLFGIHHQAVKFAADFFCVALFLTVALKTVGVRKLHIHIEDL